MRLRTTEMATMKKKQKKQCGRGMALIVATDIVARAQEERVRQGP